MQPHNSQGTQRRFILSISLTGIIFIAELAGGIWTGSLALLSDSAHVIMDIFALGLSFLALRLSARPADDRHSYGYHRLEVLAALANGLTLILISLGIWWEAIRRWQSPEQIKSLEMLVIAVAGLVVNVAVALILGGHDPQAEKSSARKDLNLRGALLHVIGDAISSVGVILAALVIATTGWNWVDPAVSVLIGGIIAVSAYRLTRSSLHILIEGVPEGLSTQHIGDVMAQVSGVQDVHDLHVWNICSEHVSLSAHIVVAPGGDSAMLMVELKNRLDKDFGIEHTTIQFEDTACLQMENGCGSIPVPVQK
ncbi:MAG TPA: cation diffusion facilitator family transporter [Anaerolineaceae bacterium]|nr:cation diffusion facilitator family transporter [Anaerolineaceae bacterium]